VRGNRHVYFLGRCPIIGIGQVIRGGRVKVS
jgi:hypothetical protein